MEHSWIILVVTAALLWLPDVSGTPDENPGSWQAETNLIDAIYSKGRRQIMEINISPECRRVALAALSEAAEADSTITCSNTTEIVDAVGEIVESVWKSMCNLADDLYVVIDELPLCYQEESDHWYGKLECWWDFIKPLWGVIKDAWNYKKFWMDPYDKITDFITCLENKKTVTTYNVATIVENARSCN